MHADIVAFPVRRIKRNMQYDAQIYSIEISDVVAERDRLNQIEVQIQRLADRAGNAGNELHMQRTAADVVVFVERKHLRLVGAAVVKQFYTIISEFAALCKPCRRGMRTLGMQIFFFHLAVAGSGWVWYTD